MPQRTGPCAVWPALAAMAAGLLVGCGGIQVRPLATGQVERQAYALSGQNLTQLRHEALRLCPQGAEVLRQAQSIDAGHEVREGEPWYSAWASATQRKLAPADEQAQMMVLCQATPGASTLARLPTTPPQPATNEGLARPALGSVLDSAARDTVPVGESDAGLTAAMPVRSLRTPQAVDSSSRLSTRSGKLAAAKAPARASSGPILSY